MAIFSAFAASYPTWWETRSVLERPANTVTNDFAPATQGQLKWFATKAAEELEASLPGGAGYDVQALIATFLNTNNLAPVNIGQAKNVIKPFYDRLIAMGFTNEYPWSSGTPADDNDFVPMNIGQLKNLFNFGQPGGPDSDGDLLPDWWENLHGLNDNDSATAGQDSDLDGLTNAQEFSCGTDPNNPDTDGDTMPDGWEFRYWQSPLVPLNPNPYVTFDFDGDGLSIWQEAQANANPWAIAVPVPGGLPGYDTDGDGMDDGWEFRHGLRADDATGVNGPAGDPDQDLVTNLQEYLGGTDPMANNDADGDGLPDVWELANGLSITSATGNDGPAGDPDGDGFSNLEEFQMGGNPHDSDTDDDTMPDAWEAQYGLKVWNAVDANENPDGDARWNYQEYGDGTNPLKSDTGGPAPDWADNKTASFQIIPKPPQPVYFVNTLAQRPSYQMTGDNPEYQPYAHLDTMFQVSQKLAESGRSWDGIYEADTGQNDTNGIATYTTVWRSAPNKLIIYQDTYVGSGGGTAYRSGQNCLKLFRARIVGTPQVIAHEGVYSRVDNITVLNGGSELTWVSIIDDYGNGGWIKLEVEWEATHPTVMISQIISDQIPNSEVNALPTTSEANNPMLMGNRSDNKSYLNVVAAVQPASLASSGFIGVRKQGTINILDNRGITSGMKTPLVFAPEARELYEVIGGIDVNSNGKLD